MKRFILLPLMALLGACFSPVHQEFNPRYPMKLGKPTVRDNRLEIPVTKKYGFSAHTHTSHLCEIQSTLENRVIEFVLLRCVFLPGFTSEPKRDIVPVISVPYDGPGVYEVVLLEGGGRKRRLGVVEVGG